MPLDTVKFQQDIVQLLTDLSTAEDPEAARQEYAQKLTTAVHALILSGDVNTVGTATAQRGKLT